MIDRIARLSKGYDATEVHPKEPRFSMFLAPRTRPISPSDVERILYSTPPCFAPGAPFGVWQGMRFTFDSLFFSGPPLSFPEGSELVAQFGQHANECRRRQ